MRIDTELHCYRAYSATGLLLGHFSSPYAAASQVLLFEKGMPERDRGGWFAARDGRPVKGHELRDVHQAGVKLFLDQQRSAA